MLGGEGNILFLEKKEDIISSVQQFLTENPRRNNYPFLALVPFMAAKKEKQNTSVNINDRNWVDETHPTSEKYEFLKI